MKYDGRFRVYYNEFIIKFRLNIIKDISKNLISFFRMDLQIKDALETNRSVIYVRIEFRYCRLLFH